MSKVGVFDTKPMSIRNGRFLTQFFNPYDAIQDKNGDVWSGGMSSDRLARVDTKSGRSPNICCPGTRKFVEYTWTIQRRR